MPYDPGKHHRRSIRLADYDYAGDGVYFVTVCVKNKECLFGGVINGRMILNETGRAVQAVWEDLPIRFAEIELDAFVVMPNHVHGIIGFVGDGLYRESEDGAASGAPTLGGVIRSFKSIVALQVNRASIRSGSLWQRNYYEHIIRDENSLNSVRGYIEDNPFQWDHDRENPVRALLAPPPTKYASWCV